jgi:hypothetical protein
MALSCYRLLHICGGNLYHMSYLNTLMCKCVARMSVCKIVRRALHRERPSKKVWLDRGQQSKFNDPRVSKTSRGHQKDKERHKKARCSV